MTKTVFVETSHNKDEVEAAIQGCYQVVPCEDGFVVTVEETHDAVDEVTADLDRAGISCYVYEKDVAPDGTSPV